MIQEKKNKRALVLSGGGSKGAIQVGVLRELLNQENKEYDLIAGISVGALNASLLASGSFSEIIPKLEKIWLKKVKNNSSVWKHHLWYYILAEIILISLLIIGGFISFILSAPKWVTILLGVLALAGFYLPYFSLRHTHSIYKTDPLKNILKSNLNLNNLKNSGKELIIGAVCFETGEYSIATEKNDNIVDWVLASSAFPVFFPMVKINNKHWTDGGVIDIAPLTNAINSGATEVDVVLTSPINPSQKEGLAGIPSQLMRFIEIMSSEILRNDLIARCSMDPDIKIRVFIPDRLFTMNALDFNNDKIKAMYEYGREIARKKLKAENE